MLRRSLSLVAGVLTACSLAGPAAAAPPPTEPLTPNVAPASPTTVAPPDAPTDASTDPASTDPAPTLPADDLDTGDGAGAHDGSDDPAVPPTVPLPVLPPIEDPDAESARLIPIPAGCPSPPPERVVFVGTLLVRDEFTGRFQVHRVRSGSVDGYTAAGMIDVRYGDEARFLDEGTTYIVGAAVDERTGVLASVVREPAPLFGGSEVAAVSATDLVCPEVDDPVRTLLLDGSTVESGVLTPLTEAKWRVLRAVLQPIGVAVLVLMGLATLKLLVFATVRSSRDIGEPGPRDALSSR